MKSLRSLLLVASFAPAQTITNSVAMKFVRVAPGSFVMGQDGPRRITM